MVLLLVGWLAQATACTGDDPALRAATVRAQAFDLAGAAALLDAPAASGCADARLAAGYLRALQTARDAYRTGGDAASLTPVTAFLETLERQPAGAPRLEIMRTVLLAAVAAAQSERDDLAILLAHATALEARAVAAGESGAPGVTAHEAAGDLWLQVHRFEEARAAYGTAAQVVGRTPRVRYGIARSASRLGDTAAACAAYAGLAASPAGADTARAEIAEARAYLRSAGCAGVPADR